MSSGAGKRGVQQVKPSKGKIVQDLDKRVQSLEMSLQVSQMLVRQLMENMQPMKTDLNELALRQRDLQYRALAFQELTSLDSAKVQELSVNLQIKDFDETSDKEDAELKYTSVDVVSEDSAVIFTSTTPKEESDKGILRSKMLLSDIQFPDLRDALLGAKPGEFIDHVINGVSHKIEIIGVRKAPAPDLLKEVNIDTVKTEVTSENVEA